MKDEIIDNKKPSENINVEKNTILSWFTFKKTTIILISIILVLFIFWGGNNYFGYLAIYGVEKGLVNKDKASRWPIWLVGKGFLRSTAKEDFLPWVKTRLKEEIPFLIHILKSSSSSNLRAQSLYILSCLNPPPKEFINLYINMMTDSNEGVRFWAVSVIGNIGEDAGGAIPVLRNMLNNDSDFMRCHVLIKLSRMGIKSHIALPEIQKMLKHKAYEIRLNAIYVIMSMELYSVKIAEDLVGLLNDPNDDVAVGAQMALGELGPSAKHVVPDLIKKLNMERNNEELKFRALSVLTSIGPWAVKAVPAIKQLFKENNSSEVFSESLDALAAIGDPSVMPTLKEMLSKIGSDKDTKTSIQKCIKKINLIEEQKLNGIVLLQTELDISPFCVSMLENVLLGGNDHVKAEKIFTSTEGRNASSSFY